MDPQISTDVTQHLIETVMSNAGPGTTSLCLLACLGLIWDRSRLTKRIDDLETRNQELVERQAQEMAKVEQLIADMSRQPPR